MHFFFGALRLDHATAVRADISKQDYTVCPRHWYVDAHMPCGGCGEIFLWSASEQRAWFEDFRFYVDSRATRCRECRARRRELTALKKQYDQTVAEAREGRVLAKKKAAVALIDQIASMADAVPARMTATRALLMRQIKKAEPPPPPIGEAQGSGST